MAAPIPATPAVSGRWVSIHTRVGGRARLGRRLRAPIVAALDRLLRANISAGSLRPGLDAEDVILALAGLWQLDPAGDWRAQAERIYDIVLGGLQRST